MNILKSLCFVSLCCLLCSACDEIPPQIPALGPNSVGERKVLIEEFSGVRCPNCPDGAEEIENLVALYGENLVPISIHASGSFAVPLPNSQFDFRTEDGEELLDLLGVPLGYPAAVVNRVPPNGSSRLQQTQSIWAGIIDQVIQQAPVLSIDLALNYDEDLRAVSVNVSILPNETISSDVALSVALVEDNIQDPQLSSSGLIEEYMHRHVFRKMLSAPKGNLLNTPLERGQLVASDFNITLEAGWKATDISIIAFVHRVGDNKEVLQVEEIKI